VSRFLCLSFFAAAKKVSAAPHRGNTNRPLTKQGKAKAIKTPTKQTNINSRKGQRKSQNKKRPTPQAYRPNRPAGKQKKQNSAKH
jgi:hypothetical protein